MNKNKYVLAIGFAAVIAGACFACGKPATPPPPDYSFEDLRSGLRKESFYFMNADKPDNAKVNLGYSFIYAAGSQKKSSMASTLSGDPSKYMVSLSATAPKWNDAYPIYYDWNPFIADKGKRGDLIFNRADFPGCSVIKFVSGWNHVGIADDIKRGTVFDSILDGGVKERNTTAGWGRTVTYYTCKRINALSDAQINACLDSAKRSYTGKPYLPSVSSTQPLATMLLRWSDKNDMTSMYCAKLVYQTFKPYIDLDTNRTAITSNSKLQSNAPGARLFSWIGVSPDNVYFSPALGRDFGYSRNLDTL